MSRRPIAVTTAWATLERCNPVKIKSNTLLACFHAELHDMTELCHDKVAAKLRRTARRLDNREHERADYESRKFLSGKGQ
jgi:hypothetical protein